MTASAASADRADRAGAWARSHPVAVDAALVAVPALLVTGLLATSGSGWLALTALVQVGVLALRRVRPVLVVVVVDAVAGLHLLTAVLADGALRVPPSNVAVLVALYSLAAHGPRWARRTGLVVALAGALLLGLALAVSLPALPWVLASATTTVAVAAVPALLAWTAGQWRRTSLAHVATLEERSRGAQVEHEQLRALAAAAERARIAREMHDVVAHSLSVVIAQADGGRYAATADPAAAARALESVAATGRAALTDMRRLLGVLREGGEGTATTPQPGADDVPGLVASVRSSGLAVALVTTGESRPLPAGAGLAVYRVVQEGLTNVLKHGGPGARATVRLHWSPGRLEVHVEDDGRGASAAAPDGVGRGQSGMAERMALYGGSLRAGPRTGGGYAVAAVLPVPGRDTVPVLAVPAGGAAPAGRPAGAPARPSRQPTG